MTRALISAAAILGLVLCGITSGAAAGAPTPKPLTHAVAIDGTTFQPATLTVNLGDTVVWTNKDPFPHTVTSTSGGFDSGAIAPGKTWKLKPTKKGDFDYVCRFHTTMHATLHVRD